MTAAIGIDIGGTAIKLGLVAPGGRILAQHGLPFEPAAPFDSVMDALAAACAGFVAAAGAGAGRVAAIGVAVPGYAEPESGVVVDGATNVPQLGGRSITQALAARTGLPVFVENDGTAATIGELRFGAGAAFRRFALITIGTGIGGGIAIDGRVVTGTRGEPPEIGALVLEPAGPRGGNRLHGTFEHYASASGFVAAYRAQGGAAGVSAQEVFARAGAGDAAAAAAVDATCRRIAQALGSMINLLNLEACLIGGGVSSAGEILLARVRAHLADFTWPLLLANAVIALAMTGNDAGLLGAAALALERLARRGTADQAG